MSLKAHNAMLENLLQEIEAAGRLEMEFDRDEILSDYRTAYRSRQASLIGRREVLTGKAKFGIFGDGKELAQLALWKACRPGDLRSGYYRDQTLMFASGSATIREFFSQLYAHADIKYDPFSAGRQMNAHFATRMLDENGEWLDLTDKFHASADSSPTASQMPRMLGLALASKFYRNHPELGRHEKGYFSKSGNEIVIGTIGDASTSEGVFWETMNAAGVLQVPLLMSVWDDNYGISVSIDYQTTKGSISTLFQGFKPDLRHEGIEVFVVKGWDYAALCATYAKAAERVRRHHVPALVHVTELTQPQGHSTSGSHERYKSKGRLEWEREYDCLNQMRKWILETGLVGEAELQAFEAEDKKFVQDARKEAWELYIGEIKKEIAEFGEAFARLAQHSPRREEILNVKSELEKLAEPFRKDIYSALRKVFVLTANENHESRKALAQLKRSHDAANYERYNSHLYAESSRSALFVEEVPVRYGVPAEIVDGRQVLQACFDAAFAREPRLMAFGEDLGRLGDVNQAFAGLQQKYGEERIYDTGIREATIIGQGIGLAMRGLRPIAEIQYLDYLLYALQIISDDLATLRYRTKSGQKAPLIIRTRGHRLEGIWHSGSPMGMIIHACRGIHVLVPRNMTQAAGFYNTLLQADEPALIIEVLNGYRLKETMPENVGEFTVPLGVPEILRKGEDITLVTYGACCRIAMEAAEILNGLNVDLEVVDVQTLLPFDRREIILQSLKKTNRIIFMDEDVPGGASAYMMQQVLEKQGGFRWLDSAPRTLTGQPHRPAYGTDGDYFSKPSVENVVELALQMMAEAEPGRYKTLY